MGQLSRLRRSSDSGLPLSSLGFGKWLGTLGSNGLHLLSREGLVEGL
jgi:hypothetical protein